jgi:PAS domain S-box-containing protein
MTSTLPAGSWELDMGTGLLTLCPRSRQMFGLSRRCAHALSEREWIDHVHPEDLRVVREAMRACLLDHKPYAERFRTIHPDGSVHVILGLGSPVDGCAERRRFAGFNLDVVSASKLASEKATENPNPFRLLERAKAIVRVRRARDRLLGRAVVGEPAYDLLLALYVSANRRRGVPLTILARSAKVPYSSALRWIAYLEDKGFVSRSQSSSDRRVILIRLTESGVAVLHDFLALR